MYMWHVYVYTFFSWDISWSKAVPKDMILQRWVVVLCFSYLFVFSLFEYQCVTLLWIRFIIDSCQDFKFVDVLFLNLLRAPYIKQTLRDNVLETTSFLRALTWSCYRVWPISSKKAWTLESAMESQHSFLVFLAVSWHFLSFVSTG